MASDREIWSVAVNVLEMHGDDVDTYLLGKVEEMNQAGNDEGLALWLAIAEHVAQLLNAPARPADLN